MAEGFTIGGVNVPPGSRQTVDLPVSVLSNHTPMSLQTQVVHGRRAGPTLFVSGVVHGDEIIGVEIIRRLLNVPALSRLRGTLLAIPIVNGFGFISHSRYLPDRRDLNRAFPGNARGSLAAQLADLFMREIVLRSDFGIDLHSAALHRVNLPQIRLSPSNPTALDLANAFGAPVVVTAGLREGSLRQAALAEGVDILLYEAGEGLRFDEVAVRQGVKGVLRVMVKLGMLPSRVVSAARRPPALCTSSYWVRAPRGGILRTFQPIGAGVEAEAVIGVISDPFGETESEVQAGEGGLIIGRTNLPIVNQGDGLFHIARVVHGPRAEAGVEQALADLQSDPMFDEDEII
ncbi:MAG: succinylglutamate desuccinylase/aspartoacylase family protein [Alphaproteobacteria bacterium]